MSDVTGFLEKLLDRAELAWVSLGEVTRPTANIKWSEADGVYQYIDLTSVDIKAKRVTAASEITAETAPSRAQKLVEENDIIFATTRPAQQRYCLIDSELAGNVASTGYCVLRAKQNQVLPKLIWHWLSTTEFKNYVEENQIGAAYPAISDGKVKAFQIPIPCPNDPERSLAIQGEIVRILDTFTELTAALTTELTQRKKQYNYYRDHLLTFDEGEVEWKKLGELAENLDSRRRPITGSLREPGEIPYYGASGIVDYVKDYIFDGDFLLVSEDGANLLARNTPIAFSISGQTWINNHAHVLKFETYEDRKFVEYYLNNIDLTPYISGAAQPKLNQKSLNGIPIPNPTPEERAHIVAILDKFDTLTTSLTEGLPREIELREKQYVYYRDQLLSFHKPDAEAT